MKVISFFIFSVYFFSFSLCSDDLEARISKIEKICEKKIDEFDQRQQDLEARVSKLEELIKIGTLRSCSEYSEYGLKTDGFYNIDPDGPLLGAAPIRVFCNFTSGYNVIILMY